MATFFTVTHDGFSEDNFKRGKQSFDRQRVSLEGVNIIVTCP